MLTILQIVEYLSDVLENNIGRALCIHMLDLVLFGVVINDRLGLRTKRVEATFDRLHVVVDAT